MKYPKNRKAFTVKEVAHACGVSRATLIRMEESGFLKPYYTDPASGYRYYDADNIAAIGQYQLLQQLGLSRNEISDLYYRKIDSARFFAEQKEKISRMQRLLNNLELRMDHSKNFSTFYLDLPETVCYCAHLKLDSLEKAEETSYELYGQCIGEGHRVCGFEPLFILCENDSALSSAGKYPEVTFCIPLSEAYDPDDPHLRLFPATKAFSMMAFGDYSLLPEMTGRFQQEMIKQKVIPTGPLRMISLIAPYAGSHYKTEDYCGEFVIPISS